MRLSYLEWPNTGEDVVLLIHDIAQCADIWRGIGNKLSERGYKVFAIDLRGHGASSWSSEGRYSADLLAEDIHAFIVAKDLYVRPVAVVGTGIGALTALMLACGASALIGAIACLEFGLPPELTAAAEADTFARRIQTLNSIDVLPWWSFWLGQAAEFMSVAECAAFLSSPLANIGPVVLPSLIPTHQSEGASRPLDIGKLMTGLSRPVASATSEASLILSRSGGVENDLKSSIGEKYTFSLKMDPKFFLSFDIPTFIRSMRSFTPHLLVSYGEKSPMVSLADAVALSALAQQAASVTTTAVPGTGHHLVSDAENDVLEGLIHFLEGPAVLSFEVGPDKDSVRRRRPETLGVRPLPAYESLEAAQRALGPRKLPSAAVVDEELRKLRLEEGGTASEEEGEEGVEDAGRTQTALAKDPPDYFGFVG